MIFVILTDVGRLCCSMLGLLDRVEGHLSTYLKIESNILMRMVSTFFIVQNQIIKCLTNADNCLIGIIHLHL